MPSNKENPARSGRRRVSQLSQMEGEKDDDYRIRRIRNNEAVRKSRDKSKRKTEETLLRVKFLKKENDALETRISAYREQLCNLKAIFLAHAGSERVNLDIDFDSLLIDSDEDTLNTSSNAVGS